MKETMKSRRYIYFIPKATEIIIEVITGMHVRENSVNKHACNHKISNII